MASKRAKGRGSDLDVPNPYVRIHNVPDPEFLNDQVVEPDSQRSLQTEFYDDLAQSIISENDSPDVPYRYSLNPYRGCEHGCSYCYARPSHEFYGLSAGLDFESRIFVKRNAAELFRAFLNRKSYVPEPILFSGVTDCYQPAERRFRLTRQCLEVALETRQPIAIITKNRLVLRDLDLLTELAESQLCRIAVSITTVDQQLARHLEPRTSPPSARFETIRELSQAGIPTHVMLAPLIPGLTDSEVPVLLERAREAGAHSAGYIVLRLPRTVEPVFLDWLKNAYPEKVSVVESRIRSVRHGQLNATAFGERMRGTGPIAQQIAQMFDLFAKRYGLSKEPTPLNVSLFRPPPDSHGQQTLF